MSERAVYVVQVQASSGTWRDLGSVQQSPDEEAGREALASWSVNIKAAAADDVYLRLARLRLVRRTIQDEVLG
jgi:hypothetical protein